MTHGHTHIISVLKIALATSFFLRRLLSSVDFEETLTYRLQLDFEGMVGRGIVGNHPAAPVTFGIMDVDDPPHVAAENHLTVFIQRTVRQILLDPLEAGLALAGEVALLLRPDLSSNKALRRHLQQAMQVDSELKYRYWGFLSLE